ncbi:MAG: DUF1232 domain-containing protein [Patescibacteria group bacterium]|jgi:uncharacterized membrane protein YkvA (DUF1232 family)
MSRNSFIPDWRSIWRYLKDPKTNWKPKALLVIALVYLLWPIDLLPDILPLMGWLDDIGFLTIAGWVLIRAVSKIAPPKE